MTLFPEWQEAHKADPSPLPERIRQMREFYGKAAEGKTCKHCAFFQRNRQAATWFKCGKSRITGGAGTDWRAGWPACGLFQEEEKP